MKSFKQYILSEAKNTHLTHAADLSFEGYSRTQEAIRFLESLVDMLRGSGDSKLNLTRKWDGAPAIICGTNPENGKFFVGTKSIFNKTPKINYTNADINKNHGGGLADKLKVALKHLSGLGIKGILQGDFLFDSSDLSFKKMDGDKYLTFTPNTITYAVGEGKLQDRIKKAKMGIVFHTKYTGKELNNMKVSFNVSESDFGKSSSVWAIDAGYKDVSGKASFTEKEYAKITNLIKKAKTSANKAKRGSNLIAKTPAISSMINIYTNAKVKQGQYSFSPREFIGFVNDKLETDVAKLKSEKGKVRKRKAKDDMVRSIRSVSKDLTDVFRLNSDLQKCVLFIIRKLEEVQSLRTFIKTANGYKVTRDEGFVASDRVGSAVKLVDRLEFSRANFTVDKNWVKG
tara:strand:- start:620 stop:1819 length:1200 start_codon:yes stop_codon:yes gene_type:complete